MIGRLVLAAGLVGLAVAGCGNSGQKKAVPAEVDVEWPDAATFPPADPDQPDPPSPDAGSGSDPSPPSGSPRAPSMSTGSDG